VFWEHQVNRQGRNLMIIISGWMAAQLKYDHQTWKHSMSWHDDWGQKELSGKTPAKITCCMFQHKHRYQILALQHVVSKSRNAGGFVWILSCFVTLSACVQSWHFGGFYKKIEFFLGGKWVFLESWSDKARKDWGNGSPWGCHGYEETHPHQESCSPKKIIKFKIRNNSKFSFGKINEN
jgi:hypothetical protein